MVIKLTTTISEEATPMTPTARRATKDSALAICFSALYAALTLVPVSPIIGLPGRTITAAAITVPIIGMILGPYLGATSALLGGAISFFSGSFSPPSFASGIAAAWLSGMLCKGRRRVSTFAYSALLFIFAFYPFIGPAWLYPPVLWLQLGGLLIMISPLMGWATKSLRFGPNSRIFPALLAVFLVSTLAGQIAGSLVFEAQTWPVFLADPNAWTSTWQATAVLYPIERTIITLAAAATGTALLKALESTNIVPWRTRKRDRKAITGTFSDQSVKKVNVDG